MQAYTISGAVNKSDVAPPVPELARTYEQRRAIFGEANPNYKHGRGTKRRHRREVDTRQGLQHRAALLYGVATYRGADGETYDWPTLIGAPLDGRAPLIIGLRARARALMNRITVHGPASGWGIAQPPRSGPGSEKWTPYEVPKASERCWRWWRRQRIELASLLKLLAWWWGKAIPPHRTAPSQTTPEEQQCSSSDVASRRVTGYRDHSAEDLRALLTRVQLRFGM